MALPSLNMVAISGRVFTYREAGAGPVVLLLHALGGSSAIWRPQFDALDSAYRIIAWDAPGYGGSDYLAGAPSAADFAEALAAFLDAIEVETAHLVGHGMGARIAAAFGRIYPERVASVAWHGGEAEIDDPRAACAPDAHEDVVAKLIASFSMVPLLARRQALAMMGRDTFAADLARVKAPKLAVAGIRKAGHYAPLENPAAFNAALVAFLAKPGARRKAAGKAKRPKPKPKTKAKGSRNADRPQRKKRAGDRGKPRHRAGDGRRAGAIGGKRRDRRA